jgi:uncharacterized protein YbcI
MTKGEPTTDDVSDEVAAELLRIHRETYGEGAQRADVAVCGDVVDCMLDELELPAKRGFIIDAGRADTVIEIQTHHQQAIETTFRAAVECATGRRVVSFASITELSPNYVVEVFRLGPRKEVPPPGAGEKP